MKTCGKCRDTGGKYVFDGNDRALPSPPKKRRSLVSFFHVSGVLLGLFVALPRLDAIALPFDAHALVAQSRRLSTGEHGDLPSLQDTCRRLLLHPTASFSTGSVWMPFVENVAVSSIQAAETFEQAKETTLSWLQAVRQSGIGSRAERTTLAARIWKKFVVLRMERDPAAVREALNAPPVDLVRGVSHAEQQSLHFAEAVLRAKLLEQGGRMALDPALLEQELASCLAGSGIVPAVRAAIAAHQARRLYAGDAAARALAELGKVWKEVLQTEDAAKVLSAAFFINWFGRGDRAAACQLFHTANDFVARKKIPAESSDIAAMREAYYRGLLLTSDQLLLLRHQPGRTKP